MSLLLLLQKDRFFKRERFAAGVFVQEVSTLKRMAAGSFVEETSCSPLYVGAKRRSSLYMGAHSTDDFYFGATHSSIF